MVGGLNKNVGHHVWSTAEIKKKKHWLKRPRTVPPCFRGHHQIVFGFRFSSRKSQRSLILQYSFTQKHLTHFTNLNSLDIESIMLPKHSQ